MRRFDSQRRFEDASRAEAQGEPRRAKGKESRAFLLFGVCTENTSAKQRIQLNMIRKLKSGEYRLYSRKRDPRTGKPHNLGTFKTRAEAARHERQVQFFKRRGA